MDAGMLDRRIRFERRESVDDGYGNTKSGDWVNQFTVWANRKYLRGGETVLAGRLSGRQPAILTIRNGINTRQITAEWRAADEVTGEIFNIRENPKMTDDRGFLEMLVEAGVAT